MYLLVPFKPFDSINISAAESNKKPERKNSGKVPDTSGDDERAGQKKVDLMRMVAPQPLPVMVKNREEERRKKLRSVNIMSFLDSSSKSAVKIKGEMLEMVKTRRCPLCSRNLRYVNKFCLVCTFFLFSFVFNGD
jgi:hypothetical protein